MSFPWALGSASKEAKLNEVCACLNYGDGWRKHGLEEKGKTKKKVVNILPPLVNVVV